MSTKLAILNAKKTYLKTINKSKSKKMRNLVKKIQLKISDLTVRTNTLLTSKTHNQRITENLRSHKKSYHYTIIIIPLG